MAKQGQHNNDDRDQDKSRGHNNPSKSMTITAGTPKKRETYDEEAREHKDPGVQAQAAKNDWQESPIDTSTGNGKHTRARNPRSGRSGSGSDASH